MQPKVYGGKDDLTAAMAYEEDGVTTVAFRKSLSADEPSDHAIDGLSQVIWAHGQPQGAYQHSPRSGLERGDASVKDFYRDDELKYHGKASYRGKFLLDFREAMEKSAGSAKIGSASFKFPPGCSGGDCTYEANLKVDGDLVDVEVTNRVGENTWTAVGFSDGPSMVS